MRILKRHFLSTTGAHRRLGFESLEKRQMLTVTVDTLVDEADGSIVDGDVSLRDAIANAPAGETIDFSVNGTINLTLGQLVIFKDLNIIGPGENTLAINASGTRDRILLVDDFNTGNLLDVQLSGMSLVGGEGEFYGGAIYHRENLTLTNIAISDSFARYGGYGGNGGGIYSNGGNLMIINSTISDNHSPMLQSYDGSKGGGIYFNSGGNLTIINSTISGNSAFKSNSSHSKGGGIYSNSGNLVITNSTISDNE